MLTLTFFDFVVGSCGRYTFDSRMGVVRHTPLPFYCQDHRGWGKQQTPKPNQLRALKQAVKVHKRIRLVKMSCSHVLWSVRVL